MSAASILGFLSGAFIALGTFGQWGGLRRRQCRVLLVVADCCGIMSGVLRLPAVLYIVAVAVWTFALITDVWRLRNDDDDDDRPPRRRKRRKWATDWSKVTLPGALRPLGAPA